MRASDIALALSATAANQLRACHVGSVWVATLAGTPSELLQHKLIATKADFVAGTGFHLQVTQIGRDVVAVLMEGTL